MAGYYVIPGTRVLAITDILEVDTKNAQFLVTQFPGVVVGFLWRPATRVNIWREGPGPISYNLTESTNDRSTGPEDYVLTTDYTPRLRVHMYTWDGYFNSP